MATSTKGLKEVKEVKDSTEQEIDPSKQEVTTKAQKPEFTEEELAQVFDSILFESEYTETIKIKGKLAVTFKTRTADESMAISKKLDVLQPNLVSTMTEQRAVINLSYSLVDYAGKDFSKASIEDKTKFIGSLPVPVISAMFDALSKFDRKTNAACAEGEASF